MVVLVVSSFPPLFSPRCCRRPSGGGAARVGSCRSGGENPLQHEEKNGGAARRPLLPC